MNTQKWYDKVAEMRKPGLVHFDTIIRVCGATHQENMKLLKFYLILLNPLN